jgi:hypothetical protein
MAEVEKQGPDRAGRVTKELKEKTTAGISSLQARGLKPLTHPIDEPSTTLGLHASHSGSTLDTEVQEDGGHGLHPLEVRRTPSKTIVSFRSSDPEHPNNWSTVSALEPSILLET